MVGCWFYVNRSCHGTPDNTASVGVRRDKCCIIVRCMWMLKIPCKIKFGSYFYFSLVWRKRYCSSIFFSIWYSLAYMLMTSVGQNARRRPAHNLQCAPFSSEIQALATAHYCLAIRCSRITQLGPRKLPARAIHTQKKAFKRRRSRSQRLYKERVRRFIASSGRPVKLYSLTASI